MTVPPALSRIFSRPAQPFRFPRTLYAAALLAGLVDALLVFYLPLHLHRNLRESKLLVVGLVVALPQFGVFLASNMWGALGDQWRRLKPLVLLGLAGYTAMLLALSMCRTSGAVLLAALVGSLLYSALKPAALSFVTLREPLRKGHALAALMRNQSIGWLIGNLGCLSMLEAFGWRAMNWALAGASLVAGAVLVFTWLRMPEIGAHEFEAREPGGEPPERGVRAAGATARPAPVTRGFWRELVALYETPALLWISVVWFFTTAGRWLFYTFFSILYTDFLRGSLGIVGLASSLSALAGVFFFGWAGRWVDRFGSRVVFLAGVLGYAVYFLVNVLITQPYLVAALFIIPIYPAFVVAGNAMVASIIRRDQRAGGLGVITGVEAFGALAGALAGGWAGDRFGIGVTPLAATILAGAALILAAGALRKPLALADES
ncbi:MAG: MFS transporter [Candidatus Eisenbacteria bacterium]|nr:MFS transporter [Candidatus Eisenbacteria bacterium]